MNHDEQRKSHEWQSEEPAAHAERRPGQATGHLTRPFERVLIATDLSEGADLAIARAGWLPLADSAEVHLVHVLAPDERAQAERRARESLDKAAQTLAELRYRSGGSPLVVRRDVLRGDAFGSISLAILEDGSDLVVVGRHGRRGIMGHFLGSTAEQLVRKVGLPVLVAHVRPEGPYRKPLFATAFEAGADRVLTALFRVTGSGADRIEMMHAVEEIPGDGLLVAGASPAEEQRYYEEQFSHAARAASALARGAGSAGEKLELVVRIGSAASVVIDEASGRETDLIAVGTRARAGLPRLLLGTTAGTVLREAPCDVLIVPL
ncbi:MAG: universal stress protein [Candidatus Sericytochromatia bacterium]|nr:universal stress protein [Candidatus Tanganyikabacteria bacterium]